MSSPADPHRLAASSRAPNAAPTPAPGCATAATFAAVAAAAERVKAFLPAGARPQVALVLGSGLGDYAEQLQDARHIDYAELGFPGSRVPGHAGRLFYGRAAGVEVLRTHDVAATRQAARMTELLRDRRHRPRQE